VRAQVQRLLDETDALLAQLAVARAGVDEEISARRLETCRRRLRNVRNTLARELTDLSLEEGQGVLVQLQRDDYERRIAP
jgi:hypothetical protein